MNKEEMRRWIDNASYEQLLHKWRFDPIGSPWFQGEMGNYYVEAMKKKRKEIGEAACAQTSKNIGWEK